MREIRHLLFWSLIGLVFYTLFSMQNRVFIPVRFTFNSPTLFSLPLLTLFSFIGGFLFSCVIFLFYQVIPIKGNEPDYGIKEMKNDRKIGKQMKKDGNEPSFTLECSNMEYSNNSKCEDCKRDLERLFVSTTSRTGDETNEGTVENIMTDKPVANNDKLHTYIKDAHPSVFEMDSQDLGILEEMGGV